MSANPEQGNGWEVQRGLISVQRATRLGEQAKALIAAPHRDIVQDHTHYLTRHVSVYEMNDWDLEQLPDNPLLLYMQETIPDIMWFAAEIATARQQVGDDKIVLNHYEAWGRILPHADQAHPEFGALDRLAVGLTGEETDFLIRDPLTQEWNSFRLRPGDAVDIRNSEFPDQAIVHAISNVSNSDRISMVK